ncbi:MAG: RHS repeat-associated core domain-containing protein [Ruminococcaceae bacterium]|nr:RHS repeat-associated core domain-containing protein [Oscillospiraceae bacterium]
MLTTTGTLASTVGAYNPFRYRSYYYDTETGFYYLQSRYYDPTVGRFLNSDGIIGANGGIEGYNMFAYCNNNPVMYADETGYYATQNFLLAANLLNKWYEMIITHFWGAVHRAVQMDIVSNNYGVYPEVAANNGRMDLYSPFDHEVWEIKHCSDNGNGLVSARKSLSKYLDAYGEGNPHKGAAGAFSGIISGCNLGDKFQYLYNITYVTPESGVVLYSFTVGIKSKRAMPMKKKKCTHMLERPSVNAWPRKWFIQVLQ